MLLDSQMMKSPLKKVRSISSKGECLNNWGIRFLIPPSLPLKKGGALKALPIIFHCNITDTTPIHNQTT